MAELPYAVRRALKGLTRAQSVAITSARWGHIIDGFYIPNSTRLDVRRRLMEKGLLGKRSFVLTSVGTKVRNELRRELSDD